jgi:outer membrane usher protein
MVGRQHKTCRWPVDLLKALVLQGLLVHVGQAQNTAPATRPTSDQTAASNSSFIADDSNYAVSLNAVDLYLDVTLNGTDVGLVHFGYKAGQLWISRANLQQLGFVLPASSPDPMRLESLQGLKVEYDSGGQSVNIVAPLRLLKLSTTKLSNADRNGPVATASPGMLLNYNVYGSHDFAGAGSLGAFTELRAFNENGVFSSTAQSLSSNARNDEGQNHFVSLDTSWSSSFPDSLLTFRIGDTLTDALSWSRTTRIAGVQVGTNFALQPYLVTAPLPSFIGSATLPSAIQLYVNGLKQYSGQVPAGPFQLGTIPNISGAGNAQVVLTNTLGQTTTLNFSLYGETQLLKQGLSDWSYELGVVRENYGLESFDYGHDPTTSGTWRYGVSNNFTAEAHAEITSGLVDGGVGGLWLLGETGGILSASLAQSTYAGERGGQYGLGYHWSNTRFNFSVDVTRTSGEYRDVGSLYGSVLPDLSAQALLSYSFDSVGSLGLSYFDLRIPQQSTERFAGVNWNKSFGRSLSLNLSVNQDLNNDRDRSAFLIVTLALDHNITVSGDLQRDNGRTGLSVYAIQAVPSQGGFGWRAGLDQGEGQNGGQGELDYLGDHGQLQAGFYDVGDARYGYASAMGSLVLMAGDVFAARQINNGFAVVSTAGIAGVPVSLQNNPVGTTDGMGLLLVTPVNSYQNNKISIDPMNLPAAVTINHVDAVASPTDRAGTLVKFDITPIRAASVILVDAANNPLPVGSRVQVHGHTGEPALVGFDGAVYLDTLDTHNVLDVTIPSGTSCHVSLVLHEQDASIPQIGPLVCREDRR